MHSFIPAQFVFFFFLLLACPYHVFSTSVAVRLPHKGEAKDASLASGSASKERGDLARRVLTKSSHQKRAVLPLPSTQSYYKAWRRSLHAYPIIVAGLLAGLMVGLWVVSQTAVTRSTSQQQPRQETKPIKPKKGLPTCSDSSGADVSGFHTDYCSDEVSSTDESLKSRSRSNSLPDSQISSGVSSCFVDSMSPEETRKDFSSVSSESMDCKSIRTPAGIFSSTSESEEEDRSSHQWSTTTAASKFRGLLQRWRSPSS